MSMPMRPGRSGSPLAGPEHDALLLSPAPGSGRGGEEPGGSAAPVQVLASGLRALRRRWWLIALVTLVAGGAALALALSATKTYEASSTLLVREDPAFRDTNGFGVDSREREVNNIVELTKLDSIARRVRSNLDLGGTTDALRDRVSATLTPASDVITLTARDTSPARAAAIANEVAEQVVAFRRRSARASLAEAARVARNEFEQLSLPERASDEGRALRTRVSELEIDAAAQTGGVQVANDAIAPTEAASPRPVRSALLGLFGGLVLSLFAVAGLEAVDRRLTREDDLEAAFGLPVLASVPKRSGGRGHDPRAEAYSGLAANLRFSPVYDSLGAVLVTSPSAGEGKTSVTLGLGVALANLGQRVIAIEADLRRPAFARTLGRPVTAGLEAVLAGEQTLQSALTHVEVPGLRAREAFDGEGGSFSVLPVAEKVANPQRLLASRAMHDVLAQARELADIVLIDTPPVGAATDAVSLVDAAEGVIFVARHNATTSDDARHAVRRLEPLGVTLLGVVVTGAPLTSPGYY